MLKLYRSIGLGGGDIDSLDDATKRGLARAAVDGLALLKEVNVGGIGKRVNGWLYPTPSMGVSGLSGDFLARASLQCLAGIVANNVEEATYLNTTTDIEGNRINGSNRYELRFEPNKLPPVRAFWSLTVYDETYNLVANPLNKYKVGTYPKGLKMDADGGLTIYLQTASPGADKESNWLPIAPGLISP